MPGRPGRRSAVKRHKDLLWVTNVIAASVLETTGSNLSDLIIPGDWSDLQGFDRCTLLSIRGYVSVSQVVLATATETTNLILNIHKTDQNNVNMQPGFAADYVTYDVLWTWGQALVNGTFAWPTYDVHIKTKRKLTTSDEIRLNFAIDPADSGAPRVKIGAVLRCLLQLDPPR